MLEHIEILVGVFILSLIVGAFLNLVIHRFPVAVTSSRKHFIFIALLTAVLSLIVALRFPQWQQLSAVLVLTWVLIPLFFIDLKHQLLPDVLTYVVLWLGLFCNAFYLFTTPSDAIIAALAAYLFFWVVAHLFKYVRKKEGLGQGDFKLLAAMAAWLGFKYLPMLVLLSSTLGVVMISLFVVLKRHRFNQAFAFGPYIILVGWLLLMVYR